MENPNWRQVLASILGVSVLGVIGYLGGARTKSVTPEAPKQKVQKFSEPVSPPVEKPKEETTIEPKEAKQIVLDVGGAVAKPGVYWLYEGARLNELVVLAGGLLPNADRDKINMAQVLRDGAKITIPYTQARTADVPNLPIADPDPEPAEQSPTEPAKSEPPKVLNLNQATAVEFEALPAIGQELARRIVKYRDGVGGFKSIEEIKQVRGIGDKLFEKIRMYLTL